MTTLSIIVPAFNSELYLNECVDSLLKQTFKDIEIILIDDGSTDRTGSICDMYCEKDFRVKVFHTKNQGVSRARNIGLKNMTGKYVSFVDSDDWVDSDFFERLIRDIGTADIVQGGIKKQRPDMSWESLLLINNVFEKEQNLLFFNENSRNDMLGTASAKIFKTNFLRQNNLMFDESLSYGEDNIFSLKGLLVASGIRVDGSSTYNYRYTNGSLSKVYDLKLRYCYIQEVFKVYARFKSSYGDSLSLNYFFMNKYFYYLSLKMKEGIQLKEIKDVYNFLEQNLNLKNKGSGKLYTRLIVLMYRSSFNWIDFWLKFQLLTGLMKVRSYLK